MKYLIGLLLIGMFFFVLVVPFYLDPINRNLCQIPETEINILQPDCDICLSSNDIPCNTTTLYEKGNMYCWELINHVHRECYQNCTIEWE